MHPAAVGVVCLDGGLVREEGRADRSGSVPEQNGLESVAKRGGDSAPAVATASEVGKGPTAGIAKERLAKGRLAIERAAVAGDRIGEAC